MFTTVIIFILILGILIFVHELGHFVAAKKNGVRVEEFGFGFPPRLFGIKMGETIYSLNWIPLGGFVRTLGEDGAERSNPKSFAAKKIWQRAAILVAGVTMNFLFAVIILGVGHIIGLPAPVTDDSTVNPDDIRIQITEVVEDSPALQAGISLGDIVKSVDGQPVARVDSFQDILKEKAKTNISIGILRGDKELTFEVTPRANPPEGQGAIGVGLIETTIVKYPWYQAFWEGLKNAVFLMISFVVAIVGMLKEWISGAQVSADIAGPVGIAIITKQVSQLGFIYLLQFTAVLSLNLVLINALPFPALDGGRLLFLVIEKIKGSPVSQKIEQAIHTTGFVLLILLMILVTFKDVMRFF